MDLNYLAGIIDGEGCIRIMKRPDGRFRPEVRITNTNHKLMDALLNAFGGAVYKKARGPASWKPGWDWVLTGGEALRLLEKVAPLLLLKGRHAQIILAVPRFRTPVTDKRRWSPDEYELVGNAFQEMRLLNQRGVAA